MELHWSESTYSLFFLQTKCLNWTLMDGCESLHMIRHNFARSGTHGKIARCHIVSLYLQMGNFDRI